MNFEYEFVPGSNRLDYALNNEIGSNDADYSHDRHPSLRLPRQASSGQALTVKTRLTGEPALRSRATEGRIFQRGSDLHR